jgi:hypothetical protein
LSRGCCFCRIGRFEVQSPLQAAWIEVRIPKSQRLLARVGNDDAKDFLKIESSRAFFVVEVNGDAEIGGLIVCWLSMSEFRDADCDEEHEAESDGDSVRHKLGLGGEDLDGSKQARRRLDTNLAPLWA